MRSINMVLGGLALAYASANAAEAGAETVLKAVQGLPSAVDQSQSFREVFVPAVARLGEGIVRIDVIGGPEITPAPKQPAALERGIIEMLHVPVTYYGGELSEAFAMLASNQPIAEMRQNGAFEMLSKKFEEQANAKLLAWGEADTQYHIYLTREPEVTEGKLSLEGFELRSTSTYAPLFTALGATPVNVPASELSTAMDRGLVEGFGWTDTGVVPLGVADTAKYRIDPGYYRSAVLTLVNLDVWNGLSDEAKDVLMQAAEEYEDASRDFMKERYEAESAELLGKGMNVVELEGPAREHYLETAYGVMWDRAAERSSDIETLKPKMYLPAD